MTEIGTLAEIGAKPGDVVEWGGNTWTVSAYSERSDSIHALRDDKWISGSAEGCRIVSRASDRPKLWRDMTPEEKGAILLAMHDGKKVEVYSNGKWFEKECMTFVDNYAYRIKPEPKVETVTTHGTWCNKGKMPKTQYVYEITFNLIDGKPDWNTAKVVGK